MNYYKHAKIEIEIPSLSISNITKDRLLNAVRNTDNKHDAIARINCVLKDTENYFKVGAGGSHIWISDYKNNRVAIIYL